MSQSNRQCHHECNRIYRELRAKLLNARSLPQVLEAIQMVGWSRGSTLWRRLQEEALAELAQSDPQETAVRTWPFQVVSEDVQQHILGYIAFQDIFRVVLVCRDFGSVCLLRVAFP